MVSHNVSEGVEPRNLCIALGQGLLHSEASSAARDNGVSATCRGRSP